MNEETKGKQEQKSAENSPKVAEVKQEKPAENSPKVAEAKQEKPAENSPKVAEAKQEKPAENSQKVAEAKQEKPAENSQKIAETKQEKPAENNPKIAETKQEKPAENNPKIAETKQEKPAENNQKIAETKQEKPAENSPKVAETKQEKPANIENIQSMLGKKIGMTQIFTENGNCIPVTLVKLGPVEVLQKKTLEKDGYEALKVGFGELPQNKKKKLNKSIQKQLFKKPYRYLKEIKATSIEKSKVGDLYDTSVFQTGNFVDVIGISKGRGFAGVIKRHNFSGGPKSHGSHFHRAPGSIGASAYPARVFKNRKMPGHYGNARVTVRGLEIVAIESKDNLIAIKGAIPGSTGRLVEVKKSTKQK